MHLDSKMVWSLKLGSFLICPIISNAEGMEALGWERETRQVNTENLICKPTKEVPSHAEEKSRGQALMVAGETATSMGAKTLRAWFTGVGLSSVFWFNN